MDACSACSACNEQAGRDLGAGALVERTSLGDRAVIANRRA